MPPRSWPIAGRPTSARRPSKDWYDGHQEMEQALVRFGRFVNDVEGAGKATGTSSSPSSCSTAARDGSEYDQSHVPVVQQYEAVGHAVRAAYTYSGMADVAVETHDARLPERRDDPLGQHRQP